MKYLPLLFLIFIYKYGYAFVSNPLVYPFPDDTEIIVHPGGKDKVKKGILKVTNPGESSWLVQSWTEDSEGKKYSAVYPALARIEAKSSLVLKIYPQLNDESKKEWMVVLFVPPENLRKPSELTIPVAYRLKINMTKSNSSINI